MIPGDEKKYIKAYLKSLSLSASPEEFVEAAVPLIRRDSYYSLSKKVYASALSVANKDQKALLRKEIERQNIRTKAR